jgi:hypothetical protein
MNFSKDYFTLFMEQAAACLKGSKKVEYASRDFKNALYLQKKRLDEHNLSLEYSFSKKGALSDKDYGVKWVDEQFINFFKFRTVGLKTVFSRDGRPVYEKDEKKTVYINIAELVNPGAQEFSDIDCPNCGRRIAHKTIEEGCPHCGTHFNVEDIYPKINNYYFLYDLSISKKESKSGWMKWAIMTGTFFFIYLFVRDLRSRVSLLISILNSVAAGIIGGAVLGYFFHSISLLVNLFSEAGKSLGLLTKTTINPRKTAHDKMKHAGYHFSYDYFVSKVIYFNKMILFAQKPDKLAFVKSGAVYQDFSNIVDCQYRGAISIDSITINTGTAYINTTCYMECFSDVNGKICRENEEFSMVLSKKIDGTINYRYSIDDVKCLGCGGSFDAFLNKKCSYCGREYSSEADDWYVLEFRKK